MQISAAESRTAEVVSFIVDRPDFMIEIWLPCLSVVNGFGITGGGGATAHWESRVQELVDEEDCEQGRIIVHARAGWEEVPLRLHERDGKDSEHFSESSNIQYVL